MAEDREAGPVTAKRARCPACLFSHRLLKDGSLGRHKVFHGPEGRTCEGSGGPPEPYDPERCGPCLTFRFMTPGLAEACASVGIERGRDAGAVLYNVLSA